MPSFTNCDRFRVHPVMEYLSRWRMLVAGDKLRLLKRDECLLFLWLRRSALAHHLADQIIDGPKYLNGGPHKFL
jgi:hypothetical protein